MLELEIPKTESLEQTQRLVNRSVRSAKWNYAPSAKGIRRMPTGLENEAKIFPVTHRGTRELLASRALHNALFPHTWTRGGGG